MSREVYAMVRQCTCCEDRTARYFTVDCPEHGLMEMDEAGYKCGGCDRQISSAEVCQRVKDAPADSPSILPVVVP